MFVLDFWSKQSVQVEQPRVTFQNQIYGEFGFSDGEVKIYSSDMGVREQAQIAERLMTTPTIKSSY